MAQQRLIDTTPRVRKKPMRILVLGMCLCGTPTISLALRKLGFTPHQMRSVLSNPSDLALWQEAINLTLLPPQDRPAHQRNQAAYGKDDFDKLLSDYDVVADIPGCLFAKELVEAYPDAKVILTLRNYADWENSMRESLWCLDTWRLFTFCRQFNLTQLAPLMQLVHSAFKAHSGNQYGGPAAKAAYERHYEEVRSVVPKERLLEIDMDGEVGWESLCGFLGTEVPKEGFPVVQEEKAMRRGLESAWWGMVQYFVLLILLPGSVVVGSYFLFVYADVLRGYRDMVLLMVKKYMDTGEW
ncbi:hypothetical protein COCMIDRAFT_93914 [Bipolaris oryzae ATCC 44560]|uniref:NAD dependent epimerase/dehydratase n=1 Tax=Bipolaris oryzae ATCC 44560 TaxID=930090 RepID=W6Z2R3_COCMI|nr:uncharacterized protein COCMIDRAFT_93914 [Bipolaris oryzae ATCC 44560]EUC46042.1 hypothetical protein COCMIDRAFT_93914 [Bipolaris oryzae ATCC 44560]